MSWFKAYEIKSSTQFSISAVLLFLHVRREKKDFTVLILLFYYFFEFCFQCKHHFLRVLYLLRPKDREDFANMIFRRSLMLT